MDAPFLSNDWVYEILHKIGLLGNKEYGVLHQTAENAGTSVPDEITEKLNQVGRWAEQLNTMIMSFVNMYVPVNSVTSAQLQKIALEAQSVVAKEISSNTTLQNQLANAYNNNKNQLSSAITTSLMTGPRLDSLKTRATKLDKQYTEADAALNKSNAKLSVEQNKFASAQNLAAQGTPNAVKQAAKLITGKEATSIDQLGAELTGNAGQSEANIAYSHDASDDDASNQAKNLINGGLQN